MMQWTIYREEIYEKKIYYITGKEHLNSIARSASNSCALQLQGGNLAPKFKPPIPPQQMLLLTGPPLRRGGQVHYTRCP